ncbi:isocitrate/isopropylmalate dehydrogenase family protein [Oceanobacillus saliphilus]|uniref:isocitrate/isopropylmalate dehydrogenase family protein n=1 Tax=Oceanobacillus saliphilus TaxID=2925834 RepID=UPI00201E5133|nr:isocitrate/isopropylmalate dehydrogenase family protein [Oceanobacillus saliphilus]
MKTYRIGVLPGDGIGKEITDANQLVLEVTLEKAGVLAEYVHLPMGFEGIEKEGTPLSQATKDQLDTCDAWILGPHDSVSYPEKFKQERNPSGELRHYFDLFSNVRPAKKMPKTKSLIEDIDLVIYRENTEGYYVDRNMYAGLGEFQVTPDVAVSTGVFTRKAIERIAHAAFKAAMVRKKKVTIVHKANVIRLGSGLFLNVCKEVGENYPEVTVDDYHIDAMAAHLVRRAGDFDVIVTENMFGDILSDLTGELAGSLGLAPSINANETQAMAQAAHGSAPDIEGKDIANPIGIMHSTVMLLEWLGNKHDDERLKDAAKLMEKSIEATVLSDIVTGDLGGSASTSSFAKAVENEVRKSEQAIIGHN